MRSQTKTPMVDRMISAYVDWREACDVVHDASRAWTSSNGSRAGVAFRRYNAALDDEQRAAETYAALARRVGHRVPRDGDLSGPLAA